MNESKTLRIAFIGAGGIAGTHMRYFQTMPDVEIVAAADVVEANLEAKRKDFDIPSTFTDYQKMLEEVQPVAVSVCMQLVRLRLWKLART